MDSGFVRLIEFWGHGESEVVEAGIIEAARQSTQGSFRGWAQDQRLLRYLYENKHSTPFEFAGAIFEIRAPLFVFREWHRHRTQSYNEASARYAPLPSGSYVPSVARLMRRANGNKQAGGVTDARALDEQAAQEFQRKLKDLYDSFEDLYEEALASGVSKELARCGMPVGRYSQMRASANLRNWMSFLTLRMDPAAQWEIRQYANAVHAALTAYFPRTMTLFGGRSTDLAGGV